MQPEAQTIMTRKAHQTSPSVVRQSLFKPSNITLVLVAVGFVALTRIFNIETPCPFYKITGLHCPGCGITRMFLAILQLNFYQAFRYNPLVFCLLPFATLLFVDYVIRSFKNISGSLYTRLPDQLWSILLIIALVYGILRNVPFFNFLAPISIN